MASPSGTSGKSTATGSLMPELVGTHIEASTANSDGNTGTPKSLSQSPKAGSVTQGSAQWPHPPPSADQSAPTQDDNDDDVELLPGAARAAQHLLSVHEDFGEQQDTIQMEFARVEAALEAVALEQEDLLSSLSHVRDDASRLTAIEAAVPKLMALNQQEDHLVDEGMRLVELLAAAKARASSGLDDAMADARQPTDSDFDNEAKEQWDDVEPEEGTSGEEADGYDRRRVLGRALMASAATTFFKHEGREAAEDRGDTNWGQDMAIRDPTPPTEPQPPGVQPPSARGMLMERVLVEKSSDESSKFARLVAGASKSAQDSKIQEIQDLKEDKENLRLQVENLEKEVANLKAKQEPPPEIVSKDQPMWQQKIARLPPQNVRKELKAAIQQTLEFHKRVQHFVRTMSATLGIGKEIHLKPVDVDLDAPETEERLSSRLEEFMVKDAAALDLLLMKSLAPTKNEVAASPESFAPELVSRPKPSPSPGPAPSADPTISTASEVRVNDEDQPIDAVVGHSAIVSAEKV